MNKEKKRKSGFSIVEVVIALAVVVIVTASALSIVMAAISARVKTVNRSEAQNFAHNMWECFKASENGTEFESNVKFAYEGLELNKDPDDETKYTYTSDKNNFEATITVNFLDAKSTFDIVVKDVKNDEEIVSFSYTKGGGT